MTSIESAQISRVPREDHFLTREAYAWWANSLRGAAPPRLYLPEYLDFGRDEYGSKVNIARQFAIALNRPLELDEIQALVGPDGEKAVCAVTHRVFQPVFWIEPGTNRPLLDALRGGMGLHDAIEHVDAEGKLIVFGAFYFSQIRDRRSHVLAFSGTPYVFVRNLQQMRVAFPDRSPLVAARHRDPRKFWGMSRTMVYRMSQKSGHPHISIQQYLPRTGSGTWLAHINFS